MEGKSLCRRRSPGSECCGSTYSVLLFFSTDWAKRLLARNDAGTTTYVEVILSLSGYFPAQLGVMASSRSRRGSIPEFNEDWIREGLVLTRVRHSPPLQMWRRGRRFDDQATALVHVFPPPLHRWRHSRPGSGEVRSRATTALRSVVVLAGLPAGEYALHALRIECSIVLSAGGGVTRCCPEKRYGSRIHAKTV